MRNRSYRLAEYKIIEKENGHLWWETHFGLASLEGWEAFHNGINLILG